MGDNDAGQARRRFLRWAFFSAVGIAIPLAARSLAKDAFTISGTVSGRPSSSADLATEEVSFLRVKVVYFQMGQYVSVSEEDFSLQSPALMRDLLNAVLMRHPTMPPQMMTSMLILVNGTPSKTSASLKDEDEIDFIPLAAGG